RINYRTTAEILAWSLGLLRGERIDDMDGGVESIAGCRSELHGHPPSVQGFTSWEDELCAVAAAVREWMDSGVAPEEIGVAVRSNRLVKEVAEKLNA
ncbi:hypothetical protein JYB64_25160, partial [Algoriphagus aestuarii]|nr:hypothetical protein [Algoriphagus aestuarii]